MRTTDNFDHDPPRKAASDSRASSTARNQAPRQPVRRPPVQMDNDSYDDDIRYDDELDEQQDQYDPEYDEYDDYDEPAPCMTASGSSAFALLYARRMRCIAYGRMNALPSPIAG